MQALVTGITGFVGGYLAEHLLALGHDVTGCSRRGIWTDQLAYLSDQVRLISCDLSNPEATIRLFDRNSYELIFHLAGLANPRSCMMQPKLAWRENVEATQSLCEAVSQCGQRPKILFVSTSYIYGQPSVCELPVNVDCEIRAEHPYAASKWEAERVGIKYFEERGLEIVRVRPFNHTGPRQSIEYIVPNWAHQITRMETGRTTPVLRVGKLDTRRDYTDVRDVVRAYLPLLLKAPSGSVFNLGSGKSRSGREILEILQELSRARFEIETDPALLRQNETLDIVADVEPLQTLTGWQPEIRLDGMLKGTLDYWRTLKGENL